MKTKTIIRIGNHSIWRESLTLAPGVRVQPPTCQPPAKETEKTPQRQLQGNPTLPGTTEDAGEPVGAEKKRRKTPHP